MLGVDPSEFLLVALVALVVIGPKDLPKAMRVVGYWVGRARGIARQFRQGFDSMVREAELEEMEKKWAAENERIMREHPSVTGADDASTSPPERAQVESVQAEPAGHGDAPPITVSAPVFVDAPQVEPAAEDATRRRGDGVTS